MKKITILFAGILLTIAACNSSNNKPPVTDTIKTTPVDTVKIDTVKPTDSIIKG
ncbi:MAG: hypothetical protein V4539_09145 [Bacteroidota bacterium]